MNHSVTFLGGFSQKLVTNTFFNLLGRSWSFLATLLLTPYILAHLDNDDFGTWILLSVFSGTLSLLDIGLGSSFVKYVSEFYTRRDYERIKRVLFAGISFYTLFGVVLVVVGLALERPLFAWFHLPDVSDAYLLILLSCAVQNVGAMFLSVIKGMQRMDKSNALEIKLSILNIVGTVVLLEAGFGLFGLAINALILACGSSLLSWWTMRQVLPQVSLGWHFDGALLREMFAYGTKIQVSRLGSHVCFQLDKLIISKILGIASVPFYEVSSRLTSFMRSVPLVMISALIPATSELGARNERVRILQIYLIASRYVSMLTVALVSFVVLDAESLLGLWLGKGFEQSVLIVQILAIGYGMNILGGAASQTGAGIGRPEFDMRSTVLLSVVNPILSIALVYRYGAPGAAAGTSIALVVSAIYLLFLFHRDYVETSVWTVVREIHLRPMASGIVAMLAVLGFHREVPEIAAWASPRYLLPIRLAVDFAVFAPIYVALLVALRQVTAIDWKNFLSLVSFGFEFIRHPFRERVKIYR